MGCCQSVEDQDGKLRNDEIENQLKRDRANMRNEIKMLLLGKFHLAWQLPAQPKNAPSKHSIHSTTWWQLGAGESGKSTILKQMKLIHDGGYSQDERESFREIIYSNTTQSMRVILEAMESMGINFEYPQNREHAALILDQPPQIESDIMPQEVGNAVKALWQDNGVKQAFSRSNEYQLNDSAQ